MLRGYGRKLFPMVGVEPPFTLGRDVVGEIVALGPLAWNFREGQLVVLKVGPRLNLSASPSPIPLVLLLHTALMSAPKPTSNRTNPDKNSRSKGKPSKKQKCENKHQNSRS